MATHTPTPTPTPPPTSHEALAAAYLPQVGGWVPRHPFLRQFARHYGTVELPPPTVANVLQAFESVGQYGTPLYDAKMRLQHFLRGIAAADGGITFRTPIGTKVSRIMLELFPEFEKQLLRVEKTKNMARPIILSCDRYDCLRYGDSRHFASCLKVTDTTDTNSTGYKNACTVAACPEIAIIYIANDKNEMIARQVVRVGYADHPSARNSPVRAEAAGVHYAHYSSAFTKPVGLYLHSRVYGTTRFDFKEFLLNQGVPIAGWPKVNPLAAPQWIPGLYLHDPTFGHFE